MNDETKKTSRREFLRDIVRNGLIAGLLTGGVVLAIRRLFARDCPQPNPCSGCEQYTRCELPKAKDSRENKEKGLPDAK